MGGFTIYRLVGFECRVVDWKKKGIGGERKIKNFKGIGFGEI